MNRKLLFSLILVIGMSIMSACGDKDESKTQEENPAEEMEMPEPDLEGIPDVVAEVNGKKISKEEFADTYAGIFQQEAMQSQMTGEEVDQDQLKDEIIEGMIGQELLIQSADSGDFDASKEAVDELLDGLAKQNGLESVDELIAALGEQGMKEEEVMYQAEMQIKVDQLIASETGEIKPTEEELIELYEQMRAQQEQMSEEEAEFPSFDELKPNLVEQIRGQKEAEVTQTLVEKLRKDADITINL